MRGQGLSGVHGLEPPDVREFYAPPLLNKAIASLISSVHPILLLITILEASLYPPSLYDLDSPLSGHSFLPRFLQSELTIHHRLHSLRSLRFVWTFMCG